LIVFHFAQCLLTTAEENHITEQGRPSFDLNAKTKARLKGPDESPSAKPKRRCYELALFGIQTLKMNTFQ